VNKQLGQEEEIAHAYSILISESLEKERERGHTLVGPHRDDLTFYLDDIELRKFGSQGQHRLFTIALKMAELFYISKQLDDLPIFLLDDMFGDLDPQKIGILLNMLEQHEGQTFITAANPALFDQHITLTGNRNCVIRIENGVVQST
jgi:DNA replication and repair protein RecF